MSNQVAAGESFDGLLYDLTQPLWPVEVEVRGDGKVLWINVGPVCVLRACRVGKVTVIDHRPTDPRGSFEFFQGILANSDSTVIEFLGDTDDLSELLDTGSITVELAGRKWELTLNIKEVK